MYHRKLFNWLNHPLLAFWLAILVLLIGGHFFEFLFLQPQGIHFIRQTDSIAFVEAYKLFKQPWWQPAVFDLSSGLHHAAGEFPLLYYFLSFLPPIESTPFLYYRLSGLCFFVWALWGSFQLFYQQTKITWLSLVVGFLPFVSVLCFYYGLTLIPDIPALAFCINAIRLAMAYQKSPSSKLALQFTLCFCLAGLFKVTFFMPALALPFYFWLQANKGEKLKAIITSSAYIALAALPVLGWYVYAAQYNQQHHNTYFLSKSAPLWSIDATYRQAVWKQVSTYWYTSYFHPDIWNIWKLGLVLLLFLFVKKWQSHAFYTLLIMLGSLGIFLLFYRQYHDHDYYFLVFLPFFTLLLFSLIRYWDAAWPHLLRRPAITIVFALLLWSSFEYARSHHRGRYHQSDLFSDGPGALMHFDRVLNKYESNPLAPVIVLGDLTANGSLVFLKRPGRSMEDTSAIWKERFDKMVSEGYQWAISLPNHDFGSIKKTYQLYPVEQTEQGVLLYRIKGEPLTTP